ncbi:MAG: hypothetical protein Q7U71_09155 [bacterium]|nr:hypothetical protein [bacterium]
MSLAVRLREGSNSGMGWPGEITATFLGLVKRRLTLSKRLRRIFLSAFPG